MSWTVCIPRPDSSCGQLGPHAGCRGASDVLDAKSVSLLYALGTPAIREPVVAGHEIALGRVFACLEREAGFVRHGHGGTQL